MLQGHMQWVISLAVVGGGTAQRLLASGSADRSVRLWDVDAGTCTAVLSGHTDSVLCLADLGGGRLLSGTLDTSCGLRVWNTVTGACLAVVPYAHGTGYEAGIRAACALPGGAATLSIAGGTTVRQWKWDNEGAGAITQDGAALQLERGHGAMSPLAAVLMPDGAQLLLTGSRDGSPTVLCNGGAGGALQQQATLVGGHSGAITGLVVMRDGCVD